MSNEKKPDKNFKIIIDQTPFDWSEPKITGSQIKQLAGVDASYGVWQDIPGPDDDPPIEDDQIVDLTGNRVERFFTGKKVTTEG